MQADNEGLFIILRKVKYGEADLILHALSSQGEKMSFLARGALRSKKRFGGGVLEPLHHVKLVYSSSSKSDLHTLKEAQLVQGFDGLRTDYDKLTFALLALECVARVSMEGDSDSASLYNLLGHLLKNLEPSPHLTILKTQFFLKFLLQQGVLEVEAWMAPFLRAALSENEQLLELEPDAQNRVGTLEKMVRHYIKTADANLSSPS
ncbi:MAG: DNA repair protein RecO [Bdellovibrionales bacterium]